MTPQLDVAVRRVELDHLDRAVGGPHAAADRAALEGRAGRRRGREDAVAVAEHDLAVGADVDEQPDPLVAVHAGGEHAGDDVAADVGAEGREDDGRAPAGAASSPISAASTGGRRRRGHHERRDAERLGVDARGPARSSWRCRRARPRRPRRGSTPASAQHLARSARPASRGRAAAAGGSASGSIIVALIRVITSPPNGCCLLSIEAHRDRRAGGEVEQRGDDGGGAEVEGDRVAAVGGVAGLDVDQGLVDDHRGHLEVGLRAAPSAAGAARAGRAVSSRSSIASSSRCQVGALVLQGRLGRARRTASAPPAAGSPGGRRRRSRPWAGWSAAARRPAGPWSPGPGRPAASRRRAAPAVKVRTSSRVTGTRPVEHLHLALLAGAVPAAGRSRSRCRSSSPRRRR